VNTTTLNDKYSFNPDQAASLLLDAMMHPITDFTLKNGTAAPAGLFNNTFGCSTLNSNNQCDHPVPQSIAINTVIGDTVGQAIFDQIASVINNISSTYNMGLSVAVTPLPLGQLGLEGLSGQLLFYPLVYSYNFPWITDFLSS